ncbi:hypothetical protein GSI_03804 [Ganoderma sinense ZZ0214-1]|uniref:Tyrosine specific protein phosphatases domain-containing protein n=1 Tax=Ganoderma sinense ZZ0214-1 TaxID=1077348 RepID=A0A2G8SK06_9APHY|nr:hypothetical protein GSI_03804 [Ganoderma sinense ZZ0214-1]
MVATVLEPRPIPSSSHPRRISRIASEPLPSHTPTSNSRPSNHSTTPREDALISQLGPHASQHHTSEYNCMKFGPKGCPLAYVPYSVQMPDHYLEMRTHQTQCADQQAWWPHKRPRKLSVKRSSTYMPRGTGSDNDVVPANASECSSVVDLREQLSAAISSSISLPQTGDDRPATIKPQPHWQTSETHPIVISTIIPPELVSTISSRLHRPAETSPVVFSVPPSHLLDHMVSSPVTLTDVDPNSPKPAPPPVVPPFIAPLVIPRSSPALSIAKSLKLSSLFWVHPTVRRALKSGGEDSPQAPYKKRPRPGSLMVPHRGSMDETILQRPKVVRNCSSPTLVEGRPKPETERNHHPHPLPLTSALPLRHISAISVCVPAVPSESTDGNSRLLGNLYMSSCPGKKVRLDGPVRGRSTVCRDLRSDLSRIKRTGTACIVCCLDDTEMQTLGVTWAEYLQTAHELSIDVLRLPIPEGLAPIDPAVLDFHLTKLIGTYTLRGDAILVHCRGGVGRAGIIACCWMLKLGLCGWMSEPLPVDRDASAESPASEDSIVDQAPEGEQVDAEIMCLVKRLIMVVRTRRSLKAVETYEQVKFLVEYVQFLRSRGVSRTAFSGDLFASWDAQVD